MKRAVSLLKESGSLVLIVSVGLVAWAVKEWFQVSDITITVLMIYAVYLYAGYESFKLKDALNDLRADFDFYREESEQEIAQIKRRIEVLYKEVDALHPGGPDRHLKMFSLNDFGSEPADKE